MNDGYEGVTSPVAAGPSPRVADPTNSATPVGLTSEQAHDLLEQVGPNEPVSGGHLGAPAQFLATFRNPLVLILLAAAVAAATLGEPVDAAIIIVIVLLSNTLNFVQTYRSQRAAERLRESVAPTATRPARRPVDRVAAPRSGARRRHPPRRRRSRPRRRAHPRGARPPRPAGGADGRIAARREDRPRARSRPRRPTPMRRIVSSSAPPSSAARRPPS